MPDNDNDVLNAQSFKDIDSFTIAAEFVNQDLIDYSAINAHLNTRTIAQRLNLMRDYTDTQMIGQIINIKRFHPKENIRWYANYMLERLAAGLQVDDFNEIDHKLFKLAVNTHVLRVVVSD